MAKPPGPGPCVYCLRESQDRNWDHLIPRAWYPDSTPADLERWKVPSCIPCNDAHGCNERDLLVRLMMCVDPKDALASGIPERMMRGMDPRAGKSEKDRRARARLNVEIRREMLDPKQAAGRGLLPNFGPDAAGASARAIRIPGAGLKTLGEKIVRAWTFCKTGRLIDQAYEMEVAILGDDRSEPVRRLVEAFGSKQERGAGIAIHWAAVREDPVCSVFIIEFWGRLKIYAAVVTRGVGEPRSFEVVLSEQVGLKERLDLTGRNPLRKKPELEVRSGDSLHRDSGRWNKLYRVIDRKRDSYKERVIDGKTGEVLRDVTGRLSDHQGRGSAKAAVPPPSKKP